MGYADQLTADITAQRGHGIDILEHALEQFAMQQQRDRETLAARAGEYAAMHQTIDRLRAAGLPLNITGCTLLGYGPTADMLVHATLDAPSIDNHRIEIQAAGFSIWGSGADSVLLDHRAGKWNLNITFTKPESAAQQVAA